MSTTKDLAAFAAGLTLADVPDAAAANASLAIADSVGCVFAGFDTAAVRLLRKVMGPEGGAPRASVIASGTKTAAGTAALLNGAAAHALDYDSISLTVSGFVASPTLFALLALAETQSEPVDGSRLLEAFVAGWEVESAIARGLGVLHYRKGWHATATLGHFGAAVAGAKLLGCDTEGICHAMGIVASEASGLRTMIGRMTNPFHVGKAARNGVLAALLARSGFDAEPGVIEHPQGFAVAFNGEGAFDLDAMTRGLGSTWDLVDPGLVIKVYPCCGLIHSAIDAALALRRDHALRPDDIAEVEVAVHAFVPPTMNIDRPATGYEAKFSTPYCLAAPLLDGEVTLATFSDDRIGDPRLQALMETVRMVVHPDLRNASTFLEREFSEVSVTLRDGTRHGRRVHRIDNRGSRGNPIAAEQLADKILDCTGRRRGRVEASLPALLDIASVKDVAALMESLR